MEPTTIKITKSTTPVPMTWNLPSDYQPFCYKCKAFGAHTCKTEPKSGHTGETSLKEVERDAMTDTGDGATSEDPTEPQGPDEHIKAPSQWVPHPGDIVIGDGILYPFQRIKCCCCCIPKDKSKPRVRKYSSAEIERDEELSAKTILKRKHRRAPL